LSALVAGEVQHRLRESTPEVRERQRFAVHASWMSVAKAAALSIGFGIFLAIVGVHTAVQGSFWLRAPYLAGLILISTALVWVLNQLTAAWPIRNRWIRALSVGGLLVLPMGLLVWAADRTLGRVAPALSDLPQYLVISLEVTIFFSLGTAALRGRGRAGPPATSADPQVRFLERLPFKLRGAELWAVEAEDHYLRLHTSKGQDLILLRLADAIAELDGLEGAQVHRSWWLARSAMADVKRGDGRATITLKDGAEVPVSRTFAKELRDKGWF
jgi:hypothetical protein